MASYHDWHGWQHLVNILILEKSINMINFPWWKQTKQNKNNTLFYNTLMPGMESQDHQGAHSDAISPWSLYLSSSLGHTSEAPEREAALSSQQDKAL